MNKELAINYINEHSLTGIKAGKERETFLEIWMVVVNDRIFARSWGLAQKSWYNSFLTDPKGAIKCGDYIIPIRASIPEDSEELKELINQAYLTKYNSEHNKKYAEGIIENKHVERTMEFIIG